MKITKLTGELERVGDHATNIAEATHFLMTGAPLVEIRPRGDETSTIIVAPPNQSDIVGGKDR